MCLHVGVVGSTEPSPFGREHERACFSPGCESALVVLWRQEELRYGSRCKPVEVAYIVFVAVVCQQACLMRGLSLCWLPPGEEQVRLCVG